jgi:MoaA/NifB/PqqE/SkfB family radical SAM enzyme
MLITVRPATNWVLSMIEQLRNYNIKFLIDIAEVTHSPNAVYELLQLHHQSEFDGADRLVFYSAYPLPDELVIHLYQASELIDISNFFIVLCGPHISKEQVIKLSETHTRDLSPFQVINTDVGDSNVLGKNFNLSSDVCPLPWMHLEVRNQGEIAPCCVYQGSIGNVQNTPLDSAFLGVDMQTLRQQFLSDIKPSGCAHCWQREQRGLSSNRAHHVNLLKKSLLTTYMGSPQITSLDLKPGNTCNFKCRICNPKSSSLFAQEQAMQDKVLVQSYNWADMSPAVFDEITNMLPCLTNIDMYGGEPFLIKPLHNLISKAVELDVAGQIRLHYNSNGSIYPEKLVPLWAKFNHVDVHFSIDNIGERFELERGGSWEQVVSNIHRLQKLNLPNLKLSIMPVISVMNVFYLDELLEWAHSLNLPVNPLYLDRPAGFNLTNLTKEAKVELNKKYSKHKWKEIQNLLAYINRLPDSTGQEFAVLTKHFDQLREQDFQVTHPMVAKLMKVC